MYMSCVDGNYSIVSMYVPWKVINLRVESSSFNASKMFWWALETLNFELLLGGRNWNVTGVVILLLLIMTAFAASIVLWMMLTPFVLSFTF